VLAAIGLMSGTARFGPAGYRAYAERERALLPAALSAAVGVTQPMAGGVIAESSAG